MTEIYTFNGKDITMNMFIQIRAVVDIIKKRKNIDFVEALGQFYHSNTYTTLQNTENGLWAESPEYIADCFFENRY
ncbi:hypothetical protein P261_02871 [Lachnospiraceae bacterium TWA4]|nr:hypothetical protein P261_02871 [Lachnospiraceae bacterium TWA4]